MIGRVKRGLVGPVSVARSPPGILALDVGRGGGGLVLERYPARVAPLQALDQHRVRDLELVEADAQHMRQLVDQNLAGRADRPGIAVAAAQ